MRRKKRTRGKTNHMRKTRRKGRMSDKDRGRVSDISQAGKEECEDE